MGRTLLRGAGVLEQARGSPPAAPPEVPVVDVEQRDVPLGMELVGQLSGFEDVQIRARVEGYLRPSTTKARAAA